MSTARKIAPDNTYASIAAKAWTMAIHVSVLSDNAPAYACSTIPAHAGLSFGDGPTTANTEISVVLPPKKAARVVVAYVVLRVDYEASGWQVSDW